MTGPDEGGLPDIAELTGRVRDPQLADRELRAATGLEPPARRTRAPQIEGDPEAVISMRRALGLE